MGVLQIAWAYRVVSENAIFVIADVIPIVLQRGRGNAYDNDDERRLLAQNDKVHNECIKEQKRLWMFGKLNKSETKHYSCINEV